MMTDREIAALMIREGVEVFKEINKDILAEPGTLTITLLPVLLMASIQSVAYTKIIRLLTERADK